MKVRKIVTVVLSVALVLSFGSMAFAEEGTTTGTGTFEGNEPEKLMQVTLPTAAAFEFIADPEGLIFATSGSRLGATADTFATMFPGASANSTMYFKKTVTGDSGTTTTYESQSGNYVAESRSPMAVDLTVKATIDATSFTGVTLVSDQTALATTKGGMYLALTDGTNTVPIVAAGATLEKSLPALAETEFVTTYDSATSSYKYGLKEDSTAKEDYTFYVTGATGGDWSAISDPSALTPKVTLTWTMEDPSAVPDGPQLTSDENITFTSAAGTLAVIDLAGTGATLKSITYETDNGQKSGTLTTAQYTTSTSEEDDTLTITLPSNMTSYFAGEANFAAGTTFTITLEGDEGDYDPIEVKGAAASA